MQKGCFKIRPPNSSLEVQHTVSAAVILPVISECPHTVILQNWASWVSGGAYRLTRGPTHRNTRGTVRIRDVASSPDLSHACTMLKRQGLHLRPLPKRRRPVVRQTSAAHKPRADPGRMELVGAPRSRAGAAAQTRPGGPRGRPSTDPDSGMHMSDGGAPWAPPRRGPPGAWRAADDAPRWFQRRLS